MLAYHGDPTIKASAIAEMRDHREAGRLVQSYGYWKTAKVVLLGV